MSQIKKKFIKNQAVDEQKILLLNEGELKARNAANSADVSLLKLDNADVLKMLKLPRLDSALAAPANAKDLVPKEYVDGEIQDKLTDELGVSIATLVGGKVPVAQLPNAIMEYKGMWNAATNTPALSNTGNAPEDLGNVYKVSHAGSVDFGAGAISFEVGDYAILGASGWEKSDSTDQVTSVNGYQGVVVLATSDVAEGGATNLYYTPTRQAAIEAYADAAVAAEATLRSNEDLTFLKLDGTRPMTGALDMASQQIKSAQRIGVGVAAPAEAIHVQGEGGHATLLDAAGAGTNGAAIAFRKAQGTIAAPTALGSGDFMGGVTARGHDGTQYTVGSRVAINFLAGGAWSSSSNPTFMQFQTTAVGAVARQTRMTITDAGRVGIGITSPTAQLHVSGDAKITQQLDMSSQKIVNVLDPTSAQDAATKAYVDQEVADLVAADIEVSPAVEGGSSVQSALENLSTAIGALESASVQFVQEKFILGAGDISNGYVTLANLAIGASINAFVDRLAIHETDDYSVSVVGGVTRITFVGNLVSPSEEQVAVGDVIRVKYAKVAI